MADKPSKAGKTTMGKGFVAVPPREGHTQKRNVKPNIENSSSQASNKGGKK